jgi:Gluconate 2-dehydrogenase subunit 3
MTQTRRDFVSSALIGAVGWTSLRARPADRHPSAAGEPRTASPLRLRPQELRTLEALGEMLLPGSAREGLAQYIDHQLSVPPAQSMLMIKYLGVSAPFAEFYRTGLACVETAARGRFGKEFGRLGADDARLLVTQMVAGSVAGWSGPPAPLFCFVLRTDAVDVVYGTQSGFERIGVPYMPHIAPPDRWGA